MVYHLFSRRLYRQIERENLRNRREHEIEFIQRRIAMLDFVLLNQGYQYLETEPEKVRFFCDTLNVQKHFLPVQDSIIGRKTSQPTVRYFVDKFPMFFVVPPSPVVTFTYIHEGASSIHRICASSGKLPPAVSAAFRVPICLCCRGSIRTSKRPQKSFNSLVKIPLESDIAGDLLRYFRVRKAWDEKRYARCDAMLT